MPVSPVTMRKVMSRFATGVTVLTTCGNGDPPHAMTANAFTSVSLDPPLILGCVARNAYMHNLLGPGSRLGVSILSADQEDVARWFASNSRPRGWRQFDFLSWWCGRTTGVPLLAGAAAWLECEVRHSFPGGDHAIVVAEVLDCSQGKPSCLAFVEGTFTPLGRSPVAPSLGVA